MDAKGLSRADEHGICDAYWESFLGKLDKNDPMYFYNWFSFSEMWRTEKVMIDMYHRANDKVNQ